MNFSINNQIVVNEEIEEGKKKYIFYNIDEDRIFVLNDSAYEIYNLFKTESNAKKVCQLLEQKYQLDKEETKAINETINDLVEKNILVAE